MVVFTVTDSNNFVSGIPSLRSATSSPVTLLIPGGSAMTLF
jgi:hypothetical protein